MIDKKQRNYLNGELVAPEVISAAFARAGAPMAVDPWDLLKQHHARLCQILSVESVWTIGEMLDEVERRMLPSQAKPRRLDWEP